MNKFHKKLLLQAGAAFSGLTLAACPLNAQERFENIESPKTVRALGKNPREKSDGNVSFEVDASRIGNFEYLLSKRIAVIFHGHAAPDRKCPYISTDEREPEYTEIAARVFRVEAPSSREEIAMVKKMGCLITDTPPLSKVLGGGQNKTGQNKAP